MARPRTMGPQFPSDTVDAFPDDPTLLRTQHDYSIDRITRPVIQDMTAANDDAITQIDIDTTKIISSLNGGETTLSTMVAIGFDETETEVLALQDDVRISGSYIPEGETELVESVRQTKFKFDETDEEWRPEAAFLLNRPVAPE